MFLDSGYLGDSNTIFLVKFGQNLTNRHDFRYSFRVRVIRLSYLLSFFPNFFILINVPKCSMFLDSRYLGDSKNIYLVKFGQNLANRHDFRYSYRGRVLNKSLNAEVIISPNRARLFLKLFSYCHKASHSLQLARYQISDIGGKNQR